MKTDLAAHKNCFELYWISRTKAILWWYFYLWLPFTSLANVCLRGRVSSLGHIFTSGLAQLLAGELLPTFSLPPWRTSSQLVPQQDALTCALHLLSFSYLPPLLARFGLYYSAANNSFSPVSICTKESDPSMQGQPHDAHSSAHFMATSEEITI